MGKLEDRLEEITQNSAERDKVQERLRERERLSIRAPVQFSSVAQSCQTL